MKLDDLSKRVSHSITTMSLSTCGVLPDHAYYATYYDNSLEKDASGNDALGNIESPQKHAFIDTTESSHLSARPASRYAQYVDYAAAWASQSPNTDQCLAAGQHNDVTGIYICAATTSFISTPFQLKKSGKY